MKYVEETIFGNEPVKCKNPLKMWIQVWPKTAYVERSYHKEIKVCERTILHVNDLLRNREEGEEEGEDSSCIFWLYFGDDFFIMLFFFNLDYY